MAKLDRIKEELGWLKVVFTVGSALDAALVAWVAHNYAVAHAVLTVLAVLAIGALTAGVVLVSYGALRRFEQLEEL